MLDASECLVDDVDGLFLRFLSLLVVMQRVIVRFWGGLLLVKVSATSVVSGSAWIYATLTVTSSTSCGSPNG